MDIILKPVGEYLYNPDSCSAEEAWTQLKIACEKNIFVVCRAVSYLEDDDRLVIDYHSIRGIINRGYITQNRYLSSDFFLDKTFCVQILQINEITKTFIATRIPVELEANRQIRLLNAGDAIVGNIIHIGRTGGYAFVEIMEGSTMFLSASNILPRKPRNCQKISDHFSVGDSVEGIVLRIDNHNDSKYETVGKMSCIRLHECWRAETANLDVGSIVEGIPHVNPNTLSGNSYYFSVSDHVYIEFESLKKPPLDTLVQIQITEKKPESYQLIGMWNESTPDPVQNSESVPNTAPESNPKVRERFRFVAPVKATVSPFAMRSNESMRFEQSPSRRVSIEAIQDKIRIGHIKELHFLILGAINDMVFCTNKMIMAYLQSTGSLYDELSQNKLNIRLSSMIKLGLIEVFRFSSEDGEGIYRVYFLARNGELVLRSYRSIRRTSYDSAALATPVQDVKRYLATNQLILAYWEQFPFFKTFKLREVFNADEDTPVRTPGRIIFANSNLLLETQRRYTGWKEKLLAKADRYLALLQHHESGTLPQRTVTLQEKKLFLLMICEDEEHAGEIRELLVNHELYQVLLFTHDLRLFNTNINQSIFRFTEDGHSIIACNAAKLLDINPKSQLDQESLRVLLHHMTRNPADTLEYLNSHNTPEIRRYVVDELKDLYRINGSGDFKAVYPEQAQFYVNLLYAIAHKPLELNPSGVSNLYKGGFSAVDECTNPDRVPSSHSSTPSDLEKAVQLAAKKIEKWIDLNLPKHAIRQTSGNQFGYDVGMEFRAYGKSFHIVFECKNYEKLREDNVDGKNSRLKVDSYAPNLLQYYMHCPRFDTDQNYWILVSPHADLQNGLQEKLFQQWNRDIPFMNLRAFTSSQTKITCREFLSIDDEAYRLIYGDEDKPLAHEKEDVLARRIFDYIIGENTLQREQNAQMSNYPFFQDSLLLSDPLMTLQNGEGDSVQETILQKLKTGQSVFLIGEYGSGKTYMTYQVIKTILDERNQVGSDFFPPLWFQLAESKMNRRHNDFDEDNVQSSAEEFLKKGLDKHKFALDFLYDCGYQKVLVILDGLDEITSGLGDSSYKLKLLKEVIRQVRLKSGNQTVFLITSREIDFKSCISNLSGDEVFGKFAKVQIGDCMIEDARDKLQALEEKEPQNARFQFKPTENDRLMNIARKPLYYGFLVELIKEWGDGCQLESEIDILREVISRSIKKYLREDPRMTEESIYDQLCQYAISISIQLTTNKESGNAAITTFNPTSVELKNVLRIQMNEYGEYQARFYHNAIREYLLADSLLTELKSVIKKECPDYSKLDRILRHVALTPEMIDFFCQLVKKTCSQKYIRLSVIDEIKNRLMKSASSAQGRMGSNLFSILCHLNTDYHGIQGLTLNGICADNLHLHKCKLENVELRNAKMPNLHLFDVELKNVDFRGTDLTGLVMGLDEDIIDVYHRIQNGKLSIFTLYADKQIMEYHFENLTRLESYEIIPMVQQMQRQYMHLYPISDDIAVYTDQRIGFLSCPQQCYELPAGCLLLDLKSDLVLISKDGIYELIHRKKEYDEWQTKRIIAPEIENICIMDSDSYLYVSDNTLFLKHNKDILSVMPLSSDFECFAAFCSYNNPKLHIFVKNRNEIQIVVFEPSSRIINSHTKKLHELAVYQKMIAINENIVYAVSGQTVHLLDLDHPYLQPIKLQIKVRCQGVTLEDPDGANRVQGDAEYELLKNAQKSKSALVAM